MTAAVCLVLLAAACAVLPPRRGVAAGRVLLGARGAGAEWGLNVSPGDPSGAGPRRLEPWWRWRPRTGRPLQTAASVETVRFLAALIAALDAGLPTGQAVTLVCGRATGPLSEAVGQAAADGSPVGEVLAARPDLDTVPGLRVVAAAWALHDRHGVVLAESLRTAALLVADEADQRRRVAAASAGPRATVRLISALPLAGPLAGWCVGLGPLGMYANPLAVLSLGVGLLVMLAGRTWSRRILASAARASPAALLSSPTGRG